MPRQEDCYFCDDCGEDYDEAHKFCPECGSNTVWEGKRDIPLDDWFHIKTYDGEDRLVEIFEVNFKSCSLGLHIEESLNKAKKLNGKVEVKFKK